jgi:DNA-binding XRE family transcriptional regulator
MKDALGNPVCIHHDIATNLAEGGQSISYELCNGRNETKCIMYETCEARKGFEGSEDSDIMVSNHNMLSQLNEHAGKKGTLVIDEPKAFTTTYKITKKDRELITKRMDNFEFRYIMHARDYLNRIITWEDQELSFTDLTLDVDLSEITNMETRHKRGVPPIKREYLQMLRKAKEASEEIGKVSKLIYILYRAKTERSIVILNEDVIEITMYDEDMRNALLREGTVIITDANADLFLDQIEAMTGNKPEFYQHSTGDNAPMERSIIKKKGANRSNWILYGNPVPQNGIEDALKHIVEWHVPGNKIGIITFFPIERAIREKKDWVPKELLDMEPMLAHYYNIRGLNDMMGLDELVTIGDPWKNRGIIEHEMRFHGITANKELHELKVCQAELYQSHGRLRPTRRKKPGRSLHIGNVTPGGFGWASATIHKPRRGSSILTARKIAEIIKQKGVSQSQVARVIGIDQSTLSKVLSGKINLSYESARKLCTML